MPIPLRVLILEDRAADAELMLQELRRAGFQPTWWRVEDEPGFVASVHRSFEPEGALDVILADCSLPSFNANRALDILRSRGVDVPLIVVSGTIGEDAAVGLMKAGAVDYLLKDRLTRLGPAVSIAIEQHRLRRERARLEEETRQSNARNAAILASAIDAIISGGHDGRIHELNPAAESMFGYRREDLLGRAVIEVLVPPRLRAQYCETMTGYVAAEREAAAGKRVELVAMRADGSEFPCEVAVARVAGAGPPMYTACVRDISARRRNECRQAAQYAFGRILAEASSLAEAAPRLLQSLCDSPEWDFGAAWAVEAPAERPGCIAACYSPRLDGAVGQSLASLMASHPREAPPASTHGGGQVVVQDLGRESESPRLRAAASAGMHVGMALYIQPRADCACVIELYSRSLRTVDDDLRRLLESFGNQIAQFIERKQTEVAERESHELLQSTIDALEEGLAILNPSGAVLKVNAAWRRLAEAHGFNPLQPGVGLNCLAAPGWNANASSLAAKLQSVLDGVTDRAAEVYDWRSAEGRRWYLCRAIRFDLRNKVRVVVSHTDITDRMLALDRMQEAKDAADAANRAKSDFLAVVSHELRTPLNGIFAMSGILSDAGLSDDLQELVDIARRSADELLALINDILDFTKIEADKLKIEVGPFDPLAVVEEVVDLLAPEAQRKGLELITRYAPGAPRSLIGDAGRIRQVLTNLVGNAVKFTERGHVLIDVENESIAGGAAAMRFRVEDTGVGIAEDRFGFIFEKFTQVDGTSTRAHGGLGLGLAITKELVELMGGRIGVRSRLGQGSVFEVNLSLPVQERAAPVGSAPAGVPGARPLIVAASPGLARVLQEQAASWGLDAAVCGALPEALEKDRDARVAGTPFNLVLLESSLAGATPAEVANHPERNFPDALVVLLSPRSSSKPHVAGPNAGVIGTPLRLSTLGDEVRSLWSAYRSRGTAPARAEEAVETRRAEAGKAAPPSGRARVHRRDRILVVEDNFMNQKAAALLLERLGYRVDLVGNGQEALKILQMLQYDLVFMDCAMPVMDGLEATRILRTSADEKLRSIPVIALTADVTPKSRERCLAVGMNDWITKPVQSQALKRVLDRYLPALQERPESVKRLQEQV